MRDDRRYIPLALLATLVALLSAFRGQDRVTTWEYQYLDAGGGGGFGYHSKRLATLANAEGAKGWELVNCFPHDGSASVYCWFKRPKQ